MSGDSDLKASSNPENSADAGWQSALSVFAAVFAVCYVLAVENNWALVTYHPKIGVWEWLTRPSKNGPAMYWFGWLGTSLLTATAASGVMLALPKRFASPVWIGWVVPLIVMFAFVYLLRGFFQAELR
jgi:hypothetical protein